MSRQPNKPWARQTIARLRNDPDFEERRRAAQLASLQEGWLTGRLGPKGRVDYRTLDGAAVRLGSRAEAVVARSLDMLGVPWKQPKRGLPLRNGRVYRPDFWLPRVRRYLEVKGGGNWERRERAVHPSREPNILAAKRSRVPVDLLEIKYPLPDLTRALEAHTVDGRTLRQALVHLLRLSPR